MGREEGGPGVWNFPWIGIFEAGWFLFLPIAGEERKTRTGSYLLKKRRDLVRVHSFGSFFGPLFVRKFRRCRCWCTHKYIQDGDDRETGRRRWEED